MSWINILKRQEVAQTSQTGMAPIDIQKPFKRVKDKGCYEKFVEIAKKVQASFSKSREVSHEVINSFLSGEHQANVMNFYYTEPNTKDNFYIHTAVKIPPKGEIPDEVYCKAIELLKKIKWGFEMSDEIGEYFLLAEKLGNSCLIEIGPESFAGLVHDKPKTALILVSHHFEDEERSREYSSKLEEKFDNWSGFP
tara:strand:+ start:126 stop:710 length:585 start_codon:yes stop_codon:yes gene_type:complete